MEETMTETQLWIVAAILVPFIYLLPAIITIFNRDHPQKAAMIAANIFLGWTFIAWAILLVLAFYKEEITKVEITKPIRITRK
jgi:hypothetical protein